MKAMNRAGNLKRMTTHQRRKTRKTEALLRQALYDGMSLLDRLSKLDWGGFTAKKERTKITTAMEK